MIKQFFSITLLMCFAFIANSQNYKELMNSRDVKVSEIIESAEAYLQEHPSKKDRKFFERWKYNAVRLQNEEGYLPSREKVQKELTKFINEKKDVKGRNSPSGTWAELGPKNWTATSGYNPGVGRITSFAQHPTDANTMIVGSDTGGIWKSTDQGSTWLPLLDNYTNMEIFSLAIDPSSPNTYYWGGSLGAIFKSTDGGTTWASISTIANGESVNKILIHPTNSMKIFATVENTGIYRSDDGGTTWTSITSDASGFDIEFKPTDTNTVYATGDSFHKSTDGGTTWVTITGFDDTGAKMIGVTAADVNRVYVIESNGSLFNGIYESTNSGSTFAKKSHLGKNYFGYEGDASDSDGQAPRDMGIAISPTNADEVHIAGVITFRSMDGGDNFIATSAWVYDGTESYCHSDVDDLVFVGTTLVALTDGGVYFATNSTATPSPTFFTDKTTGMGIHQFYKFGISQTSSVVITGGSQDNGTSTYVGSAWKNWIGADGMESFVDKTNSNILYGTQQNGTLFKSIDGGVTNESLTQPVSGDGEWVTPFEQDPIAANTIYTGFNHVHKSTDGGTSWSAISQDFGSLLTNLKIAPSDNKIMYAGHENLLYKTTTGSGTWSAVTGFSGDVNSIAIHPTDPNKVALATTGDDKVYITADGGSTWTSQKTGLPDFSAMALVWQDNPKNGLYLGMNFGVFYIEDGLTSWQAFSTNLPNVMINELEINTADNSLYAATYGRGVWRSDLYSTTVLPIELTAFKARLEDKKVHLTWSTKTEINNDYFLIEKSVDGLTWETLDQVESKGNSSEQVDYESYDNKPSPGLNYYRLIDVALSGKKQYSDVKSVNLTGVDLINIFPNPSNGRFVLFMNAANSSQLDIQVYNTYGALVKTKNVRSTIGVNEVVFDLDEEPGIYFLTIMVDGVRVYQRKQLVIQNR